MITEGLIAIGVIALIAALFLLGGRAKTKQTSQYRRDKRVVYHKQEVNLAEPLGSATTQTSLSHAQAQEQRETAKTSQVFAALDSSSQHYVDGQSLALTEHSVADAEELAYLAQQRAEDTQYLLEPSHEETLTPFDLSVSEEHDEQKLASVSQETEDHVAHIGLSVPEDAVQELVQLPKLTEPTSFVVPAQQERPVPVSILHEQPTAKLHHDVPETPMPASIVTQTVPEPPPSFTAKPISRSLRRPKSIDEQMADLTADVWALQQQAAEIVRRLSYLSACIEHSLTSLSHDTDDKHNHHN